MDLHAGLELLGGAALGLPIAALLDDQLAPLLLALPREGASLQTWPAACTEWNSASALL